MQILICLRDCNSSDYISEALLDFDVSFTRKSGTVSSQALSAKIYSMRTNNQAETTFLGEWPIDQLCSVPHKCIGQVCGSFNLLEYRT